MDRSQRWYGTVTRVLSFAFAGLVAATPALALPPDLPIDIRGDLQFYALLGCGLLLIGALVLRTMRSTPAEPLPSGRYRTHDARDDRRMTLE
jgi:hypothetical protein